MVTLEFPFTYIVYITPHFRPLRPHLCKLALGNKRRELEWEFVRILWELRGLWVSSKIYLSIEVCEMFVKSEKTYSSYTILTYKNILSPNFQLFHPSNLMRLIFHRDCEKLIFDQISWNTHPNRMGLVSLWSRSKILSYELSWFFWDLVECSLSVNGFLVVQPMFSKFESLSNYESHHDWKSSIWLIHMHTRDFGNIS